MPELTFNLTGDVLLAGYCGACGEYVGPHHVCDRPATRCCVVCARPAQIFDVGCGPWCSELCMDVGLCPVCQLPPTDYEGHWCATGAGTVWRRWGQ